MARSPLAPPLSAAPVTAYDPFIDLGRLLSRLDQNILRADGDRWQRLVTDEFQRLQARFDVTAARSLLARVEQDASTIKAASRRQEVQDELSRRRELVERLQERLDDLDEEARAAAAMDAGGAVDEVRTATADDVLVPLDAQPVSGQAGKPAKATEAGPRPESTSAHAGRDTATRRKKGRIAQATVTATIRARRGGRRSAKTDCDRGQSTSAQAAEGVEAATTAELRSTLLSTTGRGGDGDGVAAEEVLLDHHRHEQEVLSSDILRLARALKERSLATSRLLEDDKDVVDRVGEGLHTTNEHLSAAGRSMALLTRMTEGKGWWGRMMLFGMVYGLMLVLLLLFLFLPKLRL
ncbi:hypothetical protein CMQ_2524 [Grosmannia clavigera kw1407]|uniref:Synaptobrevin n=1 Tax=Grosmannia clavigera (strain kw1407 / UAMH 11150) TaxID=655863 RepID=F0XGX7_GROCL|nr:uncharacterized protein CMQ_2524 [Grosmannia clavigera kw1407]EFX02595.1 hypothetical protein CMQ_2524 [Grosmannia clavigera kw1407]